MYASCVRRSAVSGLLCLMAAAAAMAEEEKIGPIQFFRLQHASAQEVVDLLMPFFKPDSLIIRADPRTNMVIARGDERGMEAVKSSISVLDTQDTKRAGDNTEFRVFSLVHVRAASLAGSLESLLQDHSLRLVPDIDSNAILARGRPDDLKVVEAILLKLDSAESNRAPEKVAVTREQVDRAGFQSTLRAKQFDGPVRLETVDGTDTLIMRGQREDVEKALQMIRRLENAKPDADLRWRLVLEHSRLAHAVAEAAGHLESCFACLIQSWRVIFPPSESSSSM